MKKPQIVGAGASLTSRLLDVSDCVLLVIDVQESFARSCADHVGVIERMAFVAESARWLGVPAVATLELPDANGGLHPALAEVLGDAPAIEKHCYSLADDETVFPIVEATGKRTAVLVGFETDVCVALSAIDLLGRGYEVACVVDAVASPGPTAHTFGLDRMKSASVVMLSAKQVFFEWHRTYESCGKFLDAHPSVITDPPPLMRVV